MNKHMQSPLASATGPVAYALTNDYLFRTVMQRNEKVLGGLVASLLHIPVEQITSLEITNPIVLGKEIDDKEFILDINILLNNDKIINLELQVDNYHDWPERSLSYLARDFDQLNHGATYKDARSTHHISILKFTLFSDNREFYSKNMMMNVKTHKIYSDKFVLSVLDLTQIELATQEDKDYRLNYWASLFLAQTWEDIKMLAEKNDMIKEAAATMYAVSAEEDIRLRCEARERYERDQRSNYESGRSFGQKEGIDIGKKEGINIGEDQLSKLINYLIQDGKTKEISKVTTDAEYREKLYKEYHIV